MNKEEEERINHLEDEVCQLNRKIDNILSSFTLLGLSLSTAILILILGKLEQSLENLKIIIEIFQLTGFASLILAILKKRPLISSLKKHLESDDLFK